MRETVDYVLECALDHGHDFVEAVEKMDLGNDQSRPFKLTYILVNFVSVK